MLKDKIIKLRKEGNSYNKISDMLGCSKGTISYHCQNLDMNTPIDVDDRKYIDDIDETTKNSIRDYYKKHTNEETLLEFDISIWILRNVTSDIEKNRVSNYKGYNRVKDFRKRSKLKAINYKGGKCIVCGYDKCERALCFHHLIEEEKEFSISSNLNKAWGDLKKELDKCVLVCSNCHMEIHDGVTEINAHVVD